MSCLAPALRAALGPALRSGERRTATPHGALSLPAGAPPVRLVGASRPRSAPWPLRSRPAPSAERWPRLLRARAVGGAHAPAPPALAL